MHYSDDDSCFPPTVQARRDTSTTTSTYRKFVFPPGHRIRITDFINYVKSKFALAGKKRSSSTFSAKNFRNR